LMNTPQNFDEHTRLWWTQHSHNQTHIQTPGINRTPFPEEKKKNLPCFEKKKHKLKSSERLPILGILRTEFPYEEKMHTKTHTQT
jgi:hypothetical protein